MKKKKPSLQRMTSMKNDIDKIAIDAGGKDAILSITAEEKLRKLLNEREKSSLLYK